ncbi:MAG TPA: DUF4129 domain-containing protein [Candidatus Thermoplasmatota archaeon]|nr:DUF4129 domain-containing protein [Candidatus Thermoplasmatota archaeon]
MISRLVPASVTTRLARHAVPIAIGAVAVLLLVAIAATALVSPGALGITAARVSDTTDLDRISAGGLTERDADNDGLSDALENYVYGTDPQNWDSAGIGIPDGWLVEFRFDPLDPSTRDAHGEAPAASKLPAVYAAGYPSAYTPPLSVYYSYNKPTDYRPGVDAPWWRKAEHASPLADAPATGGLPVGWLLHHGVPLKDVQPDRVASGSRGNLTLLEAFEADTDPLEADSDRDGLDDWTEIHVTQTAPNKFSTAGIGIADGWLLRYKLSVTDPTVATQDPDRDGLTNFEEFEASRPTLADAEGRPTQYAKGLNPLDWQTAQTGIPDGWYVRYGLSPFGADVDQVIGRASDFAEYRTYAPEGQKALPDIVFTVRGAYEYARPDDWNESVKGVWWGGTNPVTLDSDADGLPDPIEIRGWYANVTFDTGPEAKPRAYLATSNPLEPDSDGDGLTDIEEYLGRAACGTTTERSFPPTDPRNRDTAFSQLSDEEKVCGVVRGEAKYEVRPSGTSAGLDPTKADSAGDHVKDGARVSFWHDTYEALRQSPRYPYNGNGSVAQTRFSTVHDWMKLYPSLASLSDADRVAKYRPDADVDGDGVMNVADPDPSGGLFVEKFAAPGTARDKVYFLGGPEIDPAAYRLTEFATPVPHTATDPANPDTDGDDLPDAWEIRYGRFDAARGLWDLDPGRADSDADGVTDDKANNDGDSVVWYSFEARSASNERTAHAFVFTNELEFKAETDPNELNTTADGVPDGWKAFWGSRITSGTYPSLVAARDASLGGVALAAMAEIDEALADSPITPIADLRGMGAKTTGYVRFTTAIAGCPPGDLSGELKSGERLADDNNCFADLNLDNVAVKAARIYGARTLTYADEARLRTNPYMGDTDGDGAPDAFEAHYRVQSSGGSAYPDPATDDRSKDPDGDGLNVAQECEAGPTGRCEIVTFQQGDETLGAGSDPNALDTDLDGIDDGIEVTAGNNALDTTDVESFKTGGVDKDGDTVPDFQELTGKDAKTFFGESIRTNPKDEDTDGDGLLDGLTVNLDPLADATLVAKWLARGIAHETLTDGTINFLGERNYGQEPFNMRPDKLDSVVPGVPDGWIAYYDQDPKERDAITAAYEAHKPDWWVEATEGVWWWGDDPAGAVADADHDGLHDATGEDPFPAINRLNRVVDGATTILDMRELEAWVKAAGPADAQRLRAQRIGEGAGAPQAAREAALNLADPSGVLVRDMRACVAVLDLAAPTTVDKGVEFNVSGRVVLNERAGGVCGASGALLEGSEASRVGVANRTVLVSVFAPGGDRVVGAGFTNATGAFNLSVNITEDRVYAIPAPGLVLFGNIQGSALGHFDPTQLDTGAQTHGEQNRLVAWVYNTSVGAVPGDPTYGTHKARVADRNGVVRDVNVHATRFAVSAPVPVSVRAATDIEMDVADTADNGGTLVGELTLADSSGAPLIDRTVIVKWTGSTSPLELKNLSTDRNGKINLTRVGIPVGVARPDQHQLSASFTSLDPFLLSTERILPIKVRDPTRFDARAESASATVGETVTVSGQLLARAVTLADGTERAGGAIGTAPVTLELGGVEESATTDAGGRFAVRIEVPGSIAAGPQMLRLTFAGSDTAAPTNVTLPLDIKRTARVVELNRVEGPRTIEVSIRGKLLDNEGQGFDGVIEVHSDKAGMLARGLADSDGAFAVTVPLAGLDLGTQALRVVFPGDTAHARAENLTQARVTSTTRLVIEEAPDTIVRGEVFAMRAHLVDDKGKAIVSQPIAGYWRGQRLEVIVTDASGSVSFLVPTNASERPALASLGADFTPLANGIYQPTSAAATVRVVQGVRLELGNASVTRGPVSLAGRLVDDEKHPLPGAAILFAIDGVSVGEARTSRNGSFELARVLGDDTKLGAHRASARFVGSSTVANATSEVVWYVRSPLNVDFTTLGPFVRNEQAPLEGRVTDDRGAPVDATFRMFLAGRDLGALRSSHGKLVSSIQIPADLPRGATTLRIVAPQTDAYDGFTKEFPVVVKIRPKVEVELPTLVVRGFALGGGVTLKDDQGQPLRNTSFAYVIGTSTSAVVAATNADGKGALAGVAPISGDAALALTVRGGNDVVAAQFRSTTMKVVGPATPIGYAALALAVVIVLALIGVVLAAIMLRRRQLQEAREILDEAIRDLLAGNEYAGTIFLAYRRFAAHLSRHGFAEKASDTPREFATGVRKALPIGAAPLRALIGLFEEARYSDHPIGSRERDQAVASLATVRNELNKVLGEKKVSA